LYLHASLIGGIAVSGFWSIVGERLDPHKVRRLAGYIAAGSAAGGLLGGVVARYFGQDAGGGTLLLGLAGSSVLAGVAVRVLAASSDAVVPAEDEASKVRSVTSSAYLRSMAALVTLMGLASAAIDFAFKTRVTERLASGAELVGFFAVFYAVVSVVSIAIQFSLARWMLGHFGIGTSLAVLPGAVVALGALAIALPAVSVVVLLRGAGVALETSLFRAAYEPLYAPLPLAQKRSTKSLIDVACDRLGDAFGSGIVLVAASLLPALASSIGLGAAVMAGALALVLALRLERGYVAELAASLRSGRVRLETRDVTDATTRLTLSQTALELDRESLVRQIEELRKQGTPRGETDVARAGAAPAGEGSPVQPPPSARPEPVSSRRAAATSARVSALTSGDSTRIRSELARGPLELELASLVLPLLGRDDTADAAVVALRSIAKRIPGQLIDALLDPALPMRLRRRIPRVLRACPDRRAVRGLAEALNDPTFELRHRAALALRELGRQDPLLRPPRRLVIGAVLREIERGEEAALNHVFTLLGLVFEGDALELARRALTSSDDKLRGTALEYLEHVLPEPVRSGLFTQIKAGRLPQKPVRKAAELEDELKRSFG
jgi:hypothetical protein